MEFLVHLSILDCLSFGGSISKLSEISIDKLLGGHLVEIGSQLPLSSLPGPILCDAYRPSRASCRRKGHRGNRPSSRRETDLLAGENLARLFTFAEDVKIVELKLAALAILHSQNSQHDRTTGKGAIEHFAECNSKSEAVGYLADEACVPLKAKMVTSEI